MFTPAIKEILSQRRVLGDKSAHDETVRQAEAARLTRLMEASPGFSFGRLGDFDLCYLLAPDEAYKSFEQDGASERSSEPKGSPGLAPAHRDRLRRALEKLSYLDYHEMLWKDDRCLRQADLRRAAELHRNPDKQTSYILPAWIQYEFKRFCRGKRLLFCGAEASLLSWLSRSPAFLDCASNLWESSFEAAFLVPYGGGSNLSSNLDRIKTELAAHIRANNTRVLFLSLGGASKILCQELAEETGVCAIDFGAGLRALTYSGSDGNRCNRSTHQLFYHRLPFDLHMDAVEACFPELAPHQLLAKAHAQLALEVQRKEIAWTHSAWENDACWENSLYFEEAFRRYKKRYGAFFRSNRECRAERKAFLFFCGSLNLTFEGLAYFHLIELKSFVNPGPRTATASL